MSDLIIKYLGEDLNEQSLRWRKTLSGYEAHTPKYKLEVFKSGKYWAWELIGKRSGKIERSADEEFKTPEEAQYNAEAAVKNKNVGEPGGGRLREGRPYRGMSVHGIASEIKKKYGRTVKSSVVMQYMAENGLHGDDDYPDMLDALEAVGVKVK